MMHGNRKTDAMVPSSIRLPRPLYEHLKRSGGKGGASKEIRRRLTESIEAEKTYYQRNRERILAAAQARRDAMSTEQREELRRKTNEAVSRHYAAHKDEIIEKERQRRKADPEKYRERRKKYYWANPEKHRERRKKYYDANKTAILEAAAKK